jgi:hypothetical protein
MKGFLTTATVTLAMLTSANAKPLPLCTDPNVERVLKALIRPVKFVENKSWLEVGEVEANAKRICYVYFASVRLANGAVVNGAPYQEAVYTLSWLDEANGRFSLTIDRQVAGGWSPFKDQFNRQ